LNLSGCGVSGPRETARPQKTVAARHGDQVHREFTPAPLTASQLVESENQCVVIVFQRGQHQPVSPNPASSAFMFHHSTAFESAVASSSAL
jgi:hypothetical protein